MIRMIHIAALLLMAQFAEADTPHVHDTALAPLDARATRIVVDKSDRMLWLYRGNDVIKSYSKVRLGPSPKGHKRYEGDGRTPEGTYKITERKTDSEFHLALRVSYPSAADLKRPLPRGEKSHGGDIMIHGDKTWHWTNGCVALTNTEIDEIFPLVEVGTPIEIRW